MAPAGRRPIVAASVASGVLLAVGGGGPLFSAPKTRSPVVSSPQVTAGVASQSWSGRADDSSAWAGNLSFGAVLGAVSAAAAGMAVSRQAVTARRARSSEESSRRESVLAALAAAGAALAAEEAAEAQQVPSVSPGGGMQGAAPAVELPDRINTDPYELIGMDNPNDKKEDFKMFYMKKQYRNDTYQVMKHMKISASLDKGTPNMEKWNLRVKEEMNDWLALYRRQDAVVGRQSYYSLYSAVNTLASHFTSYGTKFPFPNKRRPRFFELTNTVERYLEKGK
eukprot:gb/GFBE01030310.1/.p1 GENE.gb/GFBE01030310.1/~~gb/GFBE01030310.1/.p1  ORF type:complete len:281 (+),score=73.77 gb/GFBE01030310.1/:1-843(+)